MTSATRGRLRPEAGPPRAGLTSGPRTVSNDCRLAPGLCCWPRGCHCEPTRARAGSPQKLRAEGVLRTRASPGWGWRGTAQAPGRTARSSGQDPCPGRAGGLASPGLRGLAQPTGALLPLPPGSGTAHVTAVTMPARVVGKCAGDMVLGAAALTRPPGQSRSAPWFWGTLCGPGPACTVTPECLSFLLEAGHTARDGQGHRDEALPFPGCRTFLTVTPCGPCAGRRAPPAAPGT